MLCDAATIRYFELKFGHTHLCGVDYKHFSPDCCKCNSFGCTAAIRCGNACRGPPSDSLYSGSEHSQFNSPRLVKREAGFPNPRRLLIGSNQLWRVDDSPYYREYDIMLYAVILFGLQVRLELLAPWFFQTVSAYALRWVLKHAVIFNLTSDKLWQGDTWSLPFGYLVNSLKPDGEYILYWTGSLLVQGMACCLLEPSHNLNQDRYHTDKTHRLNKVLLNFCQN